LWRILDETGVERLRISSIEPMDVTEELIALFASSERMAQHFHMPLQSGCDRVLGAMHRWYRAEHYARRVELIRERLPDAGIGADVIAGFPGETQAEHAETVALLSGSRSATYTSFRIRSGRERELQSLRARCAAVVKVRARELRAVGEGKLKAFRRRKPGVFYGC